MPKLMSCLFYVMKKTKQNKTKQKQKTKTKTKTKAKLSWNFAAWQISEFRFPVEKKIKQEK